MSSIGSLFRCLPADNHIRHAYNFDMIGTMHLFDYIRTDFIGRKPQTICYLTGQVWLRDAEYKSSLMQVGRYLHPRIYPASLVLKVRTCICKVALNTSGFILSSSVSNGADMRLGWNAEHHLTAEEHSDVVVHSPHRREVSVLVGHTRRCCSLGIRRESISQNPRK